MFDRLFSLFSSDVFSGIFDVLWALFPVWLPLLLFTLFLHIYLRYKRAKWIMEQGSVLLELKIPKEMLKSPVAMEIVLGALYQPFVGNYLDVFLKGRVRAWFSLELVSIEGQVKFFIWAHKSFKDIIEAKIYSQFPTVEIYEVPDYALGFVFDPAKISLYGSHFKISKDDVYPIKTYIDYGMDKDPKEEFKIDPLTPVLEYLGSLKTGEFAGYQILIRAHRKEGLRDARLIKKDDWKSKAKKAVEDVVKDSVFKPEEGKSPSLMNLTEIQKETINAIQRNMAKPAFDAMIRGIYLAQKENFNPVNIAGLLGSFQQFGSGNLNSFIPTERTSFDYPWQDFRGARLMGIKKKIVDAYKRRAYFNEPHKFFGGSPYVLTTEELATLYHFPGGVAATPTFSRIVSKKGEPPSNLPL